MRATARTWGLAALGVAMLAAVGGCQILGNIQDHDADPILQGCTLPTTGDAQLRIANMAPGTAPLDVCIRASGGSFHRPVLRDSGSACPVGVPFKSVTVPFAVASGSVDVKVIPAGSTCDVPAVAEVDGVSVATGTRNTLLVGGGDGVGPAASVLVEGHVSPLMNGIYLRFVDAIGGPPGLVFGTASTATLPAQIVPFTGTVPFGAAAPAQNTLVGAIDANGYLFTSNVPLIYAAALPGSTAALLAVQPPRDSSDFTLYAAGDLADTRYPVRAVLCDDEATADATGVFVTCSESNPPSIAAGIFNTGLYGAYAPQWETRYATELATIAANPDNLDVLCLAEIGSAADQQKLIMQAKAQFPYSAVANTTLATPPDDPTDLTGQRQAPPAQAPCSNPSLQSPVQSTMSCLTGSCQDPMTGALTTASSDCMNQQCAAPFVNLLGDSNGCFDCIIAGAMSYLPFTHVQDECTNDAQAGYAFEGQTPTILLSRFPLNNVTTYVLPSFMFRRSILRAEMQLETPVDVYCGQLTFVQGSLTPYAGQFGAGPSDPSGGWANEQDLQAKQWVHFVQTHSSGRPAIILGEFASGTQYPADAGDAGAVQVASSHPAAIEQLQSAFVEAIAPGYVPQCTSCPPPRNPFNGPGPGYWTNRVFTSGFPPNATVSSAVGLDQLVVPGGPNGTKLPLSDSFAYEVRLLRP